MPKQLKFRIFDLAQNRYLSKTEELEGGFIDYYLTLDGQVVGIEEDTNAEAEVRFAALSYIGESGVFPATKRFVVQQFTGIKDKVGKDIFEGDLVEDGDGIIKEVILQNGSFVLIYNKVFDNLFDRRHYLKVTGFKQLKIDTKE